MFNFCKDKTLMLNIFRRTCILEGFPRKSFKHMRRNPRITKVQLVLKVIRWRAIYSRSAAYYEEANHFISLSQQQTTEQTTMVNSIPVDGNPLDPSLYHYKRQQTGLNQSFLQLWHLCYHYLGYQRCMKMIVDYRWSLPSSVPE